MRLPDGWGCSFLREISDSRQSSRSSRVAGVLFSCRIIEREWLRSAASPDYGGVAAAAEPGTARGARHVGVSRWLVCLPLARSGWNRWVHRSKRGPLSLFFKGGEGWRAGFFGAPGKSAVVQL